MASSTGFIQVNSIMLASWLICDHNKIMIIAASVDRNCDIFNIFIDAKLDPSYHFYIFLSTGLFNLPIKFYLEDVLENFCLGKKLSEHWPFFLNFQTINDSLDVDGSLHMS